MSRRHTTEDMSPLIDTLRRVLSSRPIATLFSTDAARSRHWLWSSHVFLTPDRRHLYMLTTTFSKLSRECREHQPLILTVHAPNEDLFITIEGRAKWLTLDRSLTRTIDFTEGGLISPDVTHDALHTWHILQLPLTHLRIQVPSHGIDLQHGRHLGQKHRSYHSGRSTRLRPSTTRH